MSEYVIQLYAGEISIMEIFHMCAIAHMSVDISGAWAHSNLEKQVGWWNWLIATQPTIEAGCFSKKKFEIYILAAPLNWKIADLALKGRLADVLLQSLLSTISGCSDRVRLHSKVYGNQSKV